MKISVIGAGLIGATSAYFLQKAGHEVTLIDRNKGAGEECSFSNGAQLSYCHAEPWASYSSLKKAVKWLGKSDAPLLFRPSLDPHMWKWLTKFILQCSNSANLKATERILKLGLYSRKILHNMESDLDFKFDHRKGGKIFIYKNQQYFERYLKQARRQELFGSRYEILNAQQTVDLEPGLEEIAGQIYATVRNPMDETADAHLYTVGMSKMLKKRGVKLKFNTNIKDIITEGDKIIALKTDKEEELKSDIFLFCTGSESPLLTRKIGLNLPIYPIKGYSITVELGKGEKGAIESITDPQERTVYSGLGKKMRVAGTAEFNGYNYDITEARINMMKNTTKKLFPKLTKVDEAEAWACLRPFVPDGMPIIGESNKYKNLYLNTGHGTLGWTQTFGSGQIIADIIEGKKPEINTDWYSIDRF